MKIFWWFLLIAGLVWIVIVPIWQTPDEQTHFAQAIFVSVKWRNPQKQEFDYSAEIDQSTIFLGTQRDKFGNNKFTHHPEYKIEYTDALSGIHEAKISALAKTPARFDFIKKEASRYPPLYYFVAAVVLKLFSSGDLFTRVYAVRLLNLGIFISILYVIWKWANKLFKNNRILSQTLMMLIGFQPMFIYSNIGVTSDGLGNLIFILYIYFMSVVFFERVLFSKSMFGFVLLTLLASVVKPQFIVTIPLSILFIILILLLKYGKKAVKLILSVSTLGILLLFLFIKSNLGPSSAVVDLVQNFSIQSLSKYTVEYTLPHTYREVLPWYFGVYKWLGVTYSRSVHRTINIILLISVVGFGLWIKKRLTEKPQKPLLFLVLTLLTVAILFYSSLAIYDWLSWYLSNYQLGIQGRYLFPTIGIHMLIILIGWQQIWPEKYKNPAIKILGILMLILNIIGLWTVANAYYDLSSFRTFIIQASQYKPEIFKGVNLILILFVYCVSLSKFVHFFLKQKSDQMERVLWV